jgi:hypothetical protein
MQTASRMLDSRHGYAQDHCLPQDKLRLEQWRPRRARQIQSSLHRKRHHPEPRVPLGNGSKSGQPLSPCVEINDKMLADISGEEVEQYLVENNLVQANAADAGVPTNAPCAHEQHDSAVQMRL